MNQKLFTVEDRFHISGKTAVAVVADYQTNIPNFDLKDEIILVRPDGAKMTAEIVNFEMIQTVSGIKKIAILIENLRKEDVPVGTEIFLKL